ncbi:MAG: 4-hydroxybenzoate octaprenyltransferase [Flavobacteriales bacterium]|nr:4-hydroxybenzoate octaprenyltransferase [Flavobacteriales bacterium]|tara:strand:+ start:2616 stop:3461 length:846 start_codon:yes stop_codon:yes gene_type:complete
MKKYLSLIKFSHTIFAIPFALIGFFLAAESYDFEWTTLLYVVLCMVFARSAAMAFNRYIDRDIDKANPRTVNVREIPSGRITPNQALIFVIINSLLFILTTYLINPICFTLSPIALIIILGYSYTKRFTALCHLILGLGLALAPIGSYLAVSGKFAVIPILFSVVVLFWVSGFDIIYSLQDEEFDKTQKLHSIPVLLGKKNALDLAKLLHFLTFATLSIAGSLGDFGLYYWLGFWIFSGLLIYQHTLVRHNDLSKVNLAFFTANGIASVIFGTCVTFDLYL